MAKLKIITLEMQILPDGLYEYRAITDGEVLTTRTACIANNGLTYIGAVITKNTRYHPNKHSMWNMFTRVTNIRTAIKDERCKRYAIAILPEYREQLRAEIRNRLAVRVLL